MPRKDMKTKRGFITCGEVRRLLDHGNRKRQPTPAISVCLRNWILHASLHARDAARLSPRRMQPEAMRGGNIFSDSLRGDSGDVVMVWFIGDGELRAEELALRRPPEPGARFS